MIKKTSSWIAGLSTTLKIVYGAVALIVLYGIYHIWFAGSGTKYQFVTVTRGTITEVVNVTGNTTPIQSLSLAFQNGGIITGVYDPVGSYVTQGSVIARLDTSDLQAQLAQAQATVDAQMATLNKLKAGATPQSIAVSQAGVSVANQALANTYSSVQNTLTMSYASANDAVRNQLSSFFTGAETSNPQLTFQTNDPQLVNNIQLTRIQASTALNEWQSEIQNIGPAFPSSSFDQSLQDTVGYLLTIKNLLNNTSNALTEGTALSPSTATTYKNNVTTGLNEVDTASTNVNSAIQNIASEKIAVMQAQANLNVTLSGSTQNDIDAQQAQVEQAQASLQSVQVKINQASLISPINGTVTLQNAKVGQIASPGAPLVSIISNNNLEVDADVAEVDIGKVTVGDAVAMTFDAFPGQTFTGKVFYVDPAQTVISGVVDYLVKVSFDKNNPQMKSGLTANLDIMTKTQDNILILPQYAIIQNTSGTFVETLNGKTTMQTPVTLGIQDESGNVEVTSGVTEGEQVVNIGLKTQ